MRRDFQRSSDLPLLEQAAGWFDRKTSGTLTPIEQSEFDRWRTQGPAHRLAFADIEAGHAAARAVANANEMLALRHEALSRIVMPAAGRGSRYGWRVGIAALITAVIGIGGWYGAGNLPGSSAQIARVAPISYQTAVGQQLSVALPDGSNVLLNTASRLRVEYSKRERRLVLERGQALFRAARDQRRPFVVRALDQIITAHGTEFDVRIADSRSVKVSLLEGTVSVMSTTAPTAPVTKLRPADVMVATNAQMKVTREPKIETEVSWRDGLIIFEDETLAEATAEVNRYVRIPIVLHDDKVRQIRISGAFRTGETAPFLEALQLSFPVRVVRRDDHQIVLGYRG